MHICIHVMVAFFGATSSSVLRGAFIVRTAFGKLSEKVWELSIFQC